jgi:hypothetical protein
MKGVAFMKKFAALLLFALFLVCSNKSPSGGMTAVTGQDGQFGTCVVALPKIALAKTTAEKFIFDLTITGPTMEPMQRSWILSGADTQAVINKIPPGELRIFTGTLTGSLQGVTHVGADTVEIIAGKTAYVNLVLRKMGNAVVNVIIEDGGTPGMSGCYAFQGRIDTTTFNNTILQILTDSTAPQMLGYLRENGAMIGKVYGPQPSTSGPVFWTISLPTSGLFTMRTYGDRMGYKGIIYRSRDTLRTVGFASGPPASCDTVVPPPPPPPPATIKLKGCFMMDGTIDTFALKGIVFHVLSDTFGSTLNGIFTQNGTVVAKVAGPQLPANGTEVNWYIGFAYAGTYLLKTKAGGPTEFKGGAFRTSDTTKVVGSAYGFQTACDTGVTPPPQTCVIDTMGGETSCKPMSVWTTYAASECASRKMSLNWITPLAPCIYGKDTIQDNVNFGWVCFQCCNE